MLKSGKDRLAENVVYPMILVPFEHFSWPVLACGPSHMLRGRLIQALRGCLRQIESGFLDKRAAKSFPAFRDALEDFAAS